MVTAKVSTVLRWCCSALCANRGVAPQKPGSDLVGLVLSQNW